MTCTCLHGMCMPNVVRSTAQSLSSPLCFSVTDGPPDCLAVCLDQSVLRHAGGSAERPCSAAADAETGPSPAAACGVNPPLSQGQVHHRVVRRLDQHEAWGTSRASPNKHGRGPDSSTTREGVAASGTGLSMFSPVKKQRVPLFNETSTIKVGATPSKPDAPGEMLRTQLATSDVRVSLEHASALAFPCKAGCCCLTTHVVELAGNRLIVCCCVLVAVQVTNCCPLLP